MALLPPEFTVHVFSCPESEAPAARPSNEARSVVADGLSMLDYRPTCFVRDMTNYSRTSISEMMIS